MGSCRPLASSPGFLVSTFLVSALGLLEKKPCEHVCANLSLDAHLILWLDVAGLGYDSFIRIRRRQICSFENTTQGTGEGVQRLRALAALAEDLGSQNPTWWLTTSHSSSPRGSDVHSGFSRHQAHVWRPDIHAGRTSLHIE